MATVADAVPLPVPDGAVSVTQLHALKDLLSDAEHPLVLLGGSRWTERARRDVRAWAEAWSLPVAVDFRCQDLMGEECEIFAGNLGFGRSEALARRLDTADLLICVGAAPGDVATDGYTLLAPQESDSRRVVHVLPEPLSPGAQQRADLALLASPEAFGAAVAQLKPDGAVPWTEVTRADRAAHLEFRRTLHDDEPLDMGAVFATLDARLEPDAVITFGAGNYALWAQRFLAYREGMRQLAPRSGSMGYSVPAGVAASIMTPGRQVVTVAGDGCFLMNGQELATAVAEGGAPLILVVDNGTYGTIRKHQEIRYPGRVSGTDLTNPDFAAYARAFGAHGETVTETAEFAPALERSLTHCRSGRPALIALRPAEGRLAPGMTVEGLRGRARGASS